MIRSEAHATISVAMCTCNGARYLQEQLDTIAAQSRRPFELVIADDRSSDGTIELLEQFAQRSAFAVHIHQNASRLGSTRNFDRVIRFCRGDYIALSDQDDRWKPEKLARLGEMLDQHAGAGMVFSDAMLIDGASQPAVGTLWRSLRFSRETRALFAANPGAVILERPVVTGATMLFRRSLLKHFSSMPSAWVHDGWITWMSILWAEALFTEEPLIEYRVHAAQQLGVGKVSFVGRIAEIRRKQRTLYGAIAHEFDLLLRYVEQAPALEMRERWEEQITQAAAFFRLRAEAPLGFGPRLLFLARHLKSYRTLSSPAWRVLVRDLLMGTPIPR
jgi:glycosyltransferase involved in cell wall biosynthesis